MAGRRGFFERDHGTSALLFVPVMAELFQREKSLSASVSQFVDAHEPVPVEEKEATLADNSGNGSHGGDFSDFGDWDDSSHDDEGRRREYWFTPRGAYKIAVIWVIGSISSLFATISTILETRWIHSKHWVAVPLPAVLYPNTAALLISSITVGFAQSSSKTGNRKERTCCCRRLFFSDASSSLDKSWHGASWRRKASILGRTPGAHSFT